MKEDPIAVLCYLRGQPAFLPWMWLSFPSLSRKHPALSPHRKRLLGLLSQSVRPRQPFSLMANRCWAPLSLALHFRLT